MELHITVHRIHKYLVKSASTHLLQQNQERAAYLSSSPRQGPRLRQLSVNRFENVFILRHEGKLPHFLESDDGQMRLGRRFLARRIYYPT